MKLYSLDINSNAVADSIKVLCTRVSTAMTIPVHVGSFVSSKKKRYFLSWQTWFGDEKMRSSSARADPRGALFKFFYYAIVVFLAWSSGPAVDVAIVRVTVEDALVDFSVCNISTSDDSVAFCLAPPLWIFPDCCPVFGERASCRDIICRDNLCSHICNTGFLRSSQSRTSFQHNFNKNNNLTDRLTVDWIKTDKEISSSPREKAKRVGRTFISWKFKRSNFCERGVDQVICSHWVHCMLKWSDFVQIFQRLIRVQVAFLRENNEFP